MQSHLRNVSKDEHEELKRVIKDHGIHDACLYSGLCERTIWTIHRKGKKKRISPKTQEGLAHLFKECAPEEEPDPVPDTPDGEHRPGANDCGVCQGLCCLAPDGKPWSEWTDPEDEQEPSEPAQQPVPPLLRAVTVAIHEGILEAERGRQPMIHLLQAGQIRIEKKLDLIAKAQLDGLIAWGLRESPNGNGE